MRSALAAFRMAAGAGAMLLASAVLLGAAIAASGLARVGADEVLGHQPLRTVRYDRDIRPLLSDRCFLCHGADPNMRKARLRLDQRDSAVMAREDGAAIVPGQPRASELWKRINSHDPDEVMPPAKSNRRPLSDGERELIRRWIEEGAEYEPHWSFAPPVKPAVPEAPAESGVRREIDRFILADLQRSGLAFSPEAERSVLLRRLFLDLTGLPPTPEELDAFLADDQPGAYERWVDRLLSLEPYLSRHAERLATPWLDQARYGDTSGIHHDQGRAISPWRDWVLNSFRENKPFDAFIVDQLAGDLVPNPTQDQIVATGFNRNHVTSDEGGAIDEEYLFEYAVDRVSTTGSVFLGLTMGCARCHDHKYDPITSSDFYSMLAFFNSIDEKGIDVQLPKNPRYAFPPSIVAANPLELARLEALLSAARQAGDAAEAVLASPEEAGKVAGFPASLATDMGVEWVPAVVAGAKSEGGAEMNPQPDGSVVVSGKNPDAETHEITLRTQSTGIRMLMLEALTDASVGAKVGRSDNGNAVVTGLRVEAVSVRDPALRRQVKLAWAWADVEQADRGFTVSNLLWEEPLGWAVDGHNRPGGRTAFFLADEPFGFEGGTELRVAIEYRSEYARHAFVRPRIRLAAVAPSGLDRLPIAASKWYTNGPYTARGDAPTFDQAFPPESAGRLDLKEVFEGDRKWKLEPRIADGAVVQGLSNTVGPMYYARRIFSPSPRRLSISFGTDDGVRVLLNGAEVFAKKIDRSLTADEEKLAFDVPAGASTIIFKVVNTAGPDGFQHRDLPDAKTLDSALVAALRPESSLSPDEVSTLKRTWLKRSSEAYRAAADLAAQAEAAVAAAKADLPQTMVMKELATPRPTFIMKRGQYDQPDKTRPVERATPAFLGALPADAPRNRLGLARWIVSDANPLTARVTVNRIWGLFFGQAIVRTTEDFGLQGEYPSHPELLDWLAVDFREHAWDLRRLIRQIVTSAAYRQSSRLRPDVAERDPENKLLSWFPRQRLAAEQIRDQALYVSGLLVEKLGGPSVKPYQPAGIWEEISMPDANTREFVRGKGEDLWRRSLYTYWKRASPPPALLTFDAPTREFCVVRRQSTSTPLQALVLWNDEQHVEAARALAARVLARAGTDAQRAEWLFLAATGRRPAVRQLESATDALAGFRARYRASPDDAAHLLAVGEAPRPDSVDPSELAAWTMVCNAVLSSDAVIVKN